jgi:hypothetical protein
VSRLVEWRRVAGRGSADISIDRAASSFRTRHSNIFLAPLPWRWEQFETSKREVAHSFAPEDVRLRKNSGLQAEFSGSVCARFCVSAKLKLSLFECDKNSNGSLAVERAISGRAFWYVTPYSLIHIPNLSSVTNSWTSNARRLIRKVCRPIGRRSDRNERSHHSSA